MTRARAYACLDRDRHWCLVAPDGEVHVPPHVTAHMRGCAALIRAGRKSANDGDGK